MLTLSICLILFVYAKSRLLNAGLEGKGMNKCISARADICIYVYVTQVTYTTPGSLTQKDPRCDCVIGGGCVGFFKPSYFIMDLSLGKVHILESWSVGTRAGLGSLRMVSCFVDISAEGKGTPNPGILSILPEA